MRSPEYPALHVATVEPLEMRRLLAVTLTQEAIITTPGSVVGAVSSGNLVFVAQSTQGFGIYNIANPASPVLVNTVPTNAVCNVVQVAGNFVFAGVATGLQVWNVADPTNPFIVGGFTSLNAVTDIQVMGSDVVLGTGTGGILVVNVSNPASPQLDSRLPTVVGNRLAASGKALYVAQGARGFAVVDLTDPANPQIVTTLLNGFNIIDLAQTNGALFAATRGNGIFSFSIASPETPVLLGTNAVPNSELLTSLATLGPDLLVAGTSSLFLENTQNPASLVTLSTLGLGRPIITSVNFNGGSEILLGTGTQGLQLVEARAIVTSFSNGVLQVGATNAPDQISITASPNSQITVQVDGLVQRGSSVGITGLFVNGLDGADLISIGDNLPPTTVLGSKGADTLISGNGSDSLIGGPGNDSIGGGAGNDTIVGGGGNNTLNGARGDDLILGGAGNDLISGGAGNDTILGGGGNDTITGGSGRDAVTTSTTGVSVLNLIDGESDTLFVNRNDILHVDPIDVIHFLNA